MGCEENRGNLFFSNLVVNKKSKGNIYTKRPVFCDNGASIIISSGKSCHLYNATTGNHVKELFQCADEIIAYQLHPLESTLVVAITENGEVTVYNLKTNEIESSVQLKLNKKILNKHNSPKFLSEKEELLENYDWDSESLDSLSDRKFIYAEVKAYQNNSSTIFIWASWCLKDENKSRLSVFTFNSGKHIGLVHLSKTGLQKCYSNFTVGTVEGQDLFVGMAIDFVVVVCIDLKKKNFYKRHYIGQNIKLTCIALHPSECVFASGDSLGRIIIWRNFFENHPLKDVFYWHVNPVHDLFFSKFGNYLFSGGEENVLVKWSPASRTKDFLPRLSSTIHRISGSWENSLLSVSTTDNKILVVDYNFQKISTIQNFSKWPIIKGENKTNVFTIDPRSNCLVVNGKTGHIQFLSLGEDGKFVYTFDVTNRNFITSDNSCIVENTQVTHAKFSKCGKWLVTAETRKGDLSRECRLKFWLYNEKVGTFSLNTNAEYPHEDSEIFSLEMSSEDVVATTGADKKFRLWCLLEYQRVQEVKEVWSVTSVNKYRNLPCRAVDFSKDSSLIAVTFGSVLTIWETESSVLKCSLSVPHKRDELIFCKFGNNELSHLVVTGTELNVTSWNTITLSTLWTVPLKLSLLISDPFTIYMAAFSTDATLIIFNPGSPTPDFLLKNVSSSPVVAAHCCYNEAGKFSLYFLDSNQDLFSLEDSNSTEAEVTTNVPATFLTPYSAQLAFINNKTESQKSKIQVNKKNQLVSTLLDAPAHTLPNPSLLCTDILKGLLVFSKGISSGNKTQDKKMESVEIRKSVQNSLDSDLNQTESKLMNLVQSVFV